jgi:hypothetical protein
MERRPQSSFWSKVFPNKYRREDIELLDLGRLISHEQVAPNIFLNSGRLRGVEMCLIAFIAVVLQIGVLFFAVFVSDSRLGSVRRPVAGFPLAVSGILAVSVGMFACAYVVEACTRQALWIPRDHTRNLRVLWVQKSQILNNQRFGSCAIFAERNRREIITSEVDPRKNFGPLASFGTCVTAVGKYAPSLSRFCSSSAD